MKILTEPIGSIPRPHYLLDAMQAFAKKEISEKDLSASFDRAVEETIRLFEKTGSPVITDGEQSKPSFATYPIHSSNQIQPGGVTIPFADGHTRQLPKLASGPFHYHTYANGYLQKAKQLSRLPVKQAVISVSALSLLYPQEGIAGYSREQFIADLINEAESDIRKCLDAGAYVVQVDFTEARLALKLDPSGGLLRSFIELNNNVLSRFTLEDRKRIGVHSCPGGDHDSTHSADISYANLLPLLFELKAGNFYLEYAAEKDRHAVLVAIKEYLKPSQRVFLGVTNVISPRIESPEEIRDTILEAIEYIPLDQFGSTDDCGFSPFADDDSTSREIAFAKIKARIDGTALAESELSKTRAVV